jgi:hypothetical protein
MWELWRAELRAVTFVSLGYRGAGPKTLLYNICYSGYGRRLSDVPGSQAPGRARTNSKKKEDYYSKSNA